MSVNFFDEKYQESSRCDSRFGLCDDENGCPAYTDTANSDMWIARVVNDGRMGITFTPIDNRITVRKEGTTNNESTCDGMLAFTNGIYLVELKNKRGGWISEARGQLENTINLLYKYNERDLASFGIKKAYICNKKHPHFVTIDNAGQNIFFKKTKFRIDIQAEIKIKKINNY